MTRITISLLLMLMLLLTSCVVHRDINDMNFVLGAAIDYNPETELYQLHVQVAKTEVFAKGEGSQEQENFLIFDGKGETLFLAIRDMAKTGRVFFWGHCDNYIISNQLARHGIYGVVDFLIRDAETRGEANLLVANVPLNELLTLQGVTEKVPITTLTDILEESLNVFGKGIKVQVRKVFNNLLNQDDSHLVSLLGVSTPDFSAPESKKKFNVSGAAVFKGDKMIGILSPTETRGYNFITNEIKNTLINVKFRGEKLVIENTSSKADITTYTENGEVAMLIEVKPKGNIALVSSQQLNLEDSTVMKEIEKIYAAMIKQELENTIDRAKEMQADFLGLGREVEIANPQLWATIKGRWQQEIFPETEVTVTVKPIILRAGLTTSTIPEEKYAKY